MVKFQGRLGPAAAAMLEVEATREDLLGFRMGFNEDQINYHGIYIIYNM